jgi:6-pyruvoyltetrahydropterin/6-carboxytetrahydropterin synthase
MSFSLRAETSFSAGHRLFDYPGKCASPHGHTYRAELVLSGDHLDATGMIKDFGTVKRELRAWITEHWDHAFLVNSSDALLIDSLKAIDESRVYVFEDLNPTAENMARTLYQRMREIIGAEVTAAVVWETAEQYAAYSESAPTG